MSARGRRDKKRAVKRAGKRTKQRGSSRTVRFLYGTRAGRAMLRGAMNTHADRIAVRFLCSGASKPIIRWYARRNGILLENPKSFRSFREFFIRTRQSESPAVAPEALISPSDGWLSVYPICEDSSFVIKGSHYRLCDLLQDRELARGFSGGDCLIVRLTPSDYHHYCYIDDGYHGEHHFIEGELHSVQPAACERYPVYTLNRRCWTLLTTDHFGPVVQTEVGAFVVGGIVNERENTSFRKGEEMGRFELAGSTIVLLFQKGRIELDPEITPHLTGEREYREMDKR